MTRIRGGWPGIRKGAADAKCGKIFTRIIKEMTVEAKLGMIPANYVKLDDQKLEVADARYCDIMVE